MTFFFPGECGANISFNSPWRLIPPLCDNELYHVRLNYLYFGGRKAEGRRKRKVERKKVFCLAGAQRALTLLDM